MEIFLNVLFFCSPHQTPFYVQADGAKSCFAAVATGTESKPGNRLEVSLRIEEHTLGPALPEASQPDRYGTGEGVTIVPVSLSEVRRQ